MMTVFTGRVSVELVNQLREEARVCDVALLRDIRISVTYTALT